MKDELTQADQPITLERMILRTTIIDDHQYECKLKKKSIVLMKDKISTLIKKSNYELQLIKSDATTH